MTNNTQDRAHLSADTVDALVTAFTDNGSIVRQRAIATLNALATVGSVTAMRDDIISAGFKPKVASVYGTAAESGRTVEAAGFALTSKDVSADTWRALNFHVERAGKKVAESARVAVLKPLLESVTPSERLDLIVTAFKALPDSKAKARKARPEGNDKSSGSSDDSGSSARSSDTVVTPLEAAHGHLLAAINLIAGLEPDDRILSAIADLSAMAAVPALELIDA